MRLEEIEKKLAENIKERAELELQQQKDAKHERTKRALYQEKAEAKRIAQANYLTYKRERDREQKIKNDAKLPRNIQAKAHTEASENIKRDKAMGLTDNEIRFKYLDKNARIREMNKEAVKKSETSIKGAKSFLSDIY